MQNRSSQQTQSWKLTELAPVSSNLKTLLFLTKYLKRINTVDILE